MKLITMSVWGDQTMYWEGALENARIHQEIYPGWKMRIYTDTENSYTEKSKQYGIEIHRMPNLGGFYGAFWRFLPAADANIEAIIIRDADSRLNTRESTAVAQWLASGKAAHTMRDHPHHLNWPIMAGMWGIRGGIIPDMAERIEKWGKWQNKLDDQYFLAYNVWPQIRTSCLQHCRGESPWGGEPFPPHPPCSCDYVGQVYYDKNTKDIGR